MSNNYVDSKFIRSSKEPRTNAVSHNIKRWQWIALAGIKGRSFSEVNAPNSIYRQNIKRKGYKGNDCSIVQDLNYDIKNGWIREIKQN